MLAVKFYGIKDVRVEEIGQVAATPEQALVKVLYGGICGSDLHIYREGMFVETLQETMGHEFVGVIESAPEGSDFRPGDLVTADPRVPCGACIGCRSGETHRCTALGYIGEVSPGGFAEYIALRPETLVKFKPDTDPKQGVLAEPLAVAVHACRRIVSGGYHNALVIGAGPIGLLIAFLLKKQYRLETVGVADIDAYRIEKSRALGIDLAVDSVEEVPGRFDCIVDAVGLEVVLKSAMQALRPGGTIYVSAIYEKLPVTDINQLVCIEGAIVGNNSYSYDDLVEAVRILDSKSLDFSWLVTRILPGKEAPEAFRLLTAKEKQDLKILLEF